MDYPYPSLWINGRLVVVKNVVEQHEVPQTSFERSTFDFIRAWFSGQEEFDIKTSGSTGDPKIIRILRKQMIESALLTERALGLKNSESCLICIDTKFIGGMMMLVRAFTSRLRIFAVDPSADPMEKLPPGQWVSFAAFVPYQIENILESKRPHSLDDVDKVIIGGAPLRESTIEKFKTYRSHFYATYGMTETISHVALQKLNGENRSDFFDTLPGISIDLDDRGCMLLKVPYLESTIITNDVVELLSPTRFKWKGRFDHIINTGGIKVNPEKVEAAIARVFETSSFNARFFVHGVEDPYLGSRVVLVIEANKIDEHFLSKLYPSLAAVLSPFEIPKEAFLVSGFSLTENGKINRLQTVKGLGTAIALPK
jgi:o-succinylbenzoate---CoA ligase